MKFARVACVLFGNSEFGKSIFLAEFYSFSRIQARADFESKKSEDFSITGENFKVWLLKL